MTELPRFSYNFACTIMSDILYEKIKTKLLFNKNPLIINLKGKLKKPFDFFLRCQTCLIWLAHLLVKIPPGFELRRNWSIQMR